MVECFTTTAIIILESNIAGITGIYYGLEQWGNFLGHYLTMFEKSKSILQAELNAIREAGLYKKERIITTPQGAAIKTSDGKEVLNFCANNYLH